VDHAVATALSPDGGTLLILTSGYNVAHRPTGERVPELSTDFVFIFDLSARVPELLQAISIPAAFWGLAWNPSGKEFYVSGGVDDAVHVFSRRGRRFAKVASVPLGHTSGLGIDNKPVVAGLAVNRHGDRLLAANWANDSVSIVDIGTRQKLAEVDLRPGKADVTRRGVAGGEFPFGVAIGGETTAYVSSLRDREIVVVDIAALRVIARIHLRGQPNHLLLNRDGTRLYAACDNSDAVAVVDTSTNAVLEEIPVAAPAPFLPEPRLKGSSPNFLALSPDEKTLYVTNGGTNAVSVVGLGGTGARSAVSGLVPTGWYPDAVSVSRDGKRLFVVNGKSPPGPNPAYCARGCEGKDQYVLQMEKAGFSVIPVPRGAELARLTRLVAANNGWEPRSSRAADVMAAVRKRIRHVIYVVKENRTFDQVLGDLGRGDGDPGLAMFGEPITPNQHRLARDFVTFDRFFDSGETSGYGWNWSTAARTNDATEKMQPVSYAGRGGTYDWEGANRNVNVGIDSPSERRAANPQTPDDPDLLPGTADVAEHDGPEGEPGAGYLWDAALRAGLSVRNYGFFLDLTLYDSPPPLQTPLLRRPWETQTRVGVAAKASLVPVTDPYFRGFQTAFPDYWRFREWEREFETYERNGDLPRLSLVRFMNDHTGDFAKAIDGVDTPLRQVADNDYATGLLVERVAKSRFKDDTLIFVIEDDAQDGPDHVDAHRSIAFVVGPLVKRGAVVSTRYTTVSMVRTILDVLGLPSLGLFDGTQEPMSDAFDPASDGAWSFTAVVPDALRDTRLPLPAPTSRRAEPGPVRREKDSAWWAGQTFDMDFRREDRLDARRFNRILWQGIMGDDVSYPGH
jgi:YVTN family beta-propeller protein